MALDPSTAPDGSEHAALPPEEWADALLRARRPGAVRPVFQPIVDLRRGVVCGYEMLARFVGPPEAPPDVWFRRAGEHGMAIELEAKMIKVGLEARESLPDNCFLTINLDPASLPDPQVQAALAHHKRLHGVVIELTEHSRADAEEILERLAEIRSRGAMIAIDDVGSGYSGLLQIGVLRPEFMKIDRSLIAGLQDDPAKCEMVESLGAVANRTDAWIVAEGIEGEPELEKLMSLGVPLGQAGRSGARSRRCRDPRSSSAPSSASTASRPRAAKRRRASGATWRRSTSTAGRPTSAGACARTRTPTTSPSPTTAATRSGSSPGPATAPATASSPPRSAPSTARPPPTWPGGRWPAPARPASTR